MNTARTSSRAHSGVAHCPVATPVPAIRQYIAKRVSIEHRGYITPCWVWQQCVNHHGYAVANMPIRGWARVHRAAYEEFVGPIPAGLETDHLCRVKACCNPDHLEPVTRSENLARFWATQPPKPESTGPKYPPNHCRHGHEYTPENTGTNHRDGSRKCRTCKRLSRKRFKQLHPDKVRADASKYYRRHNAATLPPLVSRTGLHPPGD